jgi:hypothetical protein
MPEGQNVGQVRFRGTESGTGPVSTNWRIVGYGVALPRTARGAPGGLVFHILNRGVARVQLVRKAADCHAFEGVLRETRDQSPMRICACSLMPNHRHPLRWPERLEELDTSR